MHEKKLKKEMCDVSVVNRLSSENSLHPQRKFHRFPNKLCSSNKLCCRTFLLSKHRHSTPKQRNTQCCSRYNSVFLPFIAIARAVSFDIELMSMLLLHTAVPQTHLFECGLLSTRCASFFFWGGKYGCQMVYDSVKCIKCFHFGRTPVEASTFLCL